MLTPRWYPPFDLLAFAAAWESHAPRGGVHRLWFHQGRHFLRWYRYLQRNLSQRGFFPRIWPMLASLSVASDFSHGPHAPAYSGTLCGSLLPAESLRHPKKQLAWNLTWPLAHWCEPGENPLASSSRGPASSRLPRQITALSL